MDISETVEVQRAWKIFETPLSEIKCVLSVKESNFIEKNQFSHLLMVRAEVADPAPLTVSLTVKVKYPLLSLKSRLNMMTHKGKETHSQLVVHVLSNHGK